MAQLCTLMYTRSCVHLFTQLCLLRRNPIHATIVNSLKDSEMHKAACSLLPLITMRLVLGSHSCPLTPAGQVRPSMRQYFARKNSPIKWVQPRAFEMLEYWNCVHGNVSDCCIPAWAGCYVSRIQKFSCSTYPANYIRQWGNWSCYCERNNEMKWNEIYTRVLDDVING